MSPPIRSSPPDPPKGLITKQMAKEIVKKVKEESEAKQAFRAHMVEFKKLYPAEFEVRNAPGGEFEQILASL